MVKKRKIHVLSKVNFYTAIILFVVAFVLIPYDARLEAFVNGLPFIAQLAFYGVLFGGVRYVMDKYLVDGD